MQTIVASLEHALVFQIRLALKYINNLMSYPVCLTNTKYCV